MFKDLCLLNNCTVLFKVYNVKNTTKQHYEHFYENLLHLLKCVNNAVHVIIITHDIKYAYSVTISNK